jgi:hypothetical protein
MNSISVGIRYGLSMFGVGFVVGTIRVLLLMPYLQNELQAVLLEAPVMMYSCWHLCRWSIESISKPAYPWTSSLTAYLTLLLCEVGLSLVLFQRSIEELVKDLSSNNGLVGLLAQAICSFHIVILLPKDGDQRKKGN